MKNKKSIIFISKKEGYTLLEVLVAVAVFSIAISAPVGLFISSLRGQRKALEMKTIVDNTSYAIDYISRALRMAQKDDLDFGGGGGVNCLAGDKVNYEITYSGQGIRFRNHSNECQEFFLDTDGVLKEEKGGGDAVALTSSNLTINFLDFNLLGEAQGDLSQPRVTMVLEITGKDGTASPVTRIQTTVSQRNLDVTY